MTRQGKKHEYLGMLLTYKVLGKVKIDMWEYLNKVLTDRPNKIQGIEVTLDTLHLFDIDKKITLLSEEGAGMFHHIVAQLLYLSKRGKTDIQTSIAFPATFVKKPQKNDWSKLHCIIPQIHQRIGAHPRR